MDISQLLQLLNPGQALAPGNALPPGGLVPGGLPPGMPMKDQSQIPTAAAPTPPAAPYQVSGPTSRQPLPVIPPQPDPANMEPTPQDVFASPASDGTATPPPSNIFGGADPVNINPDAAMQSSMPSKIDAFKMMMQNVKAPQAPEAQRLGAPSPYNAPASRIDPNLLAMFLPQQQNDMRAKELPILSAMLGRG